MAEIYPVPESFVRKAHLDDARYQSMYKASLEDAETFWSEQAHAFLSWIEPWQNLNSADFETGRFAWFEGAKLNACVNCVDRHLGSHGDQVALIWESDNPGVAASITYRELSAHVNRLANALRERGVDKGDRVCLYMPMIPEAVYAMLACARIGAIHSVVFGGFSSQSLRDRILDSDCQTLITADEGVRGGATVPLKKNADIALEQCPNVHTVLTVRRTGGDIDWVADRDVWYHE